MLMFHTVTSGHACLLSAYVATVTEGCKQCVWLVATLGHQTSKVLGKLETDEALTCTN